MNVSGLFHAPVALPQWVGGWVVSRAVLDVVMKRKSLFLLEIESQFVQLSSFILLAEL
jgi:hypothetical protein